MRLRWLATTCALVVTLALGPVSIHAVPLSDLVSTGGTITAGDKVFSNFRVIFFSFVEDTRMLFRPGQPPLVFSSDADPDATSEINVAAMTFGPEAHGLVFTVPASAFKADSECRIGGLPSATHCVDASLRLSFDYTVSVLGPDLIESVSMSAVDFVLQGAAGGSISAAGSNLFVDGTTLDTFTLPAPVSTFDMSTSINLSATHDCFFGFCSAGNVSFTSLLQAFSQVTPATVPEPDALGLLTTGLVTLATLGRRLRTVSRRPSAEGGRFTR